MMPSATTRSVHLVSGLALLFSLTSASPSAAQTVYESSTSTTQEVTITGRVTTTNTERVIVPEPAPVVVVQPMEVAPAPSSGPGLVPLLTMRAELTLSGVHDDIVLAGATAMFGLDAGNGWGGGLVVGYVSSLGFSDDPSEIQLALEAWRDFGPGDDIGFRLVARGGTNLLLDEHGPSPYPFGQLGIGARASLDPRIALLIDARGELRTTPAEADVDTGFGPDLVTNDGFEVGGGFVMTLGLAIGLD